MLRYLYWRWLKYKRYFEHPNGIAAFGMLCSNALIRELGLTAKAIKRQIKTLEKTKDNIKREKEELKKTVILENDDYHTVRLNLKLGVLFALVLLLTELGTNYFTALIMFGPESTGLVGAILKWGTAIGLTIFGVIATDQFFESLFPVEKYKSKSPPEPRNIPHAVFFGILLAGIELMIYEFGLSRATDVKGAADSTGLKSDLAFAIVLLSMILPLIIGGIARYLNKYRGAYQNRKAWDKNQKGFAKTDLALGVAHNDKHLKFQELATAWWDTYNRFKDFKESYNFKNGIEEDLKKHENYKFLKDLDVFKALAFTHFTQELGDRLRELPEEEFVHGDDGDLDEEAVQNA